MEDPLLPVTPGRETQASDAINENSRCGCKVWLRERESSGTVGWLKDKIPFSNTSGGSAGLSAGRQFSAVAKATQQSKISAPHILALPSGNGQVYVDLCKASVLSPVMWGDDGSQVLQSQWAS